MGCVDVDGRPTGLLPVSVLFVSLVSLSGHLVSISNQGFVEIHPSFMMICLLLFFACFVVEDVLSQLHLYGPTIHIYRNCIYYS